MVLRFFTEPYGDIGGDLVWRYRAYYEARATRLAPTTPIAPVNVYRVFDCLTGEYLDVAGVSLVPASDDSSWWDTGNVIGGKAEYMRIPDVLLKADETDKLPDPMRLSDAADAFVRAGFQISTGRTDPRNCACELFSQVTLPLQ